MKQRLIDRYMNEPIIVGGLETTRAKYIRELEEAGFQQKHINWIMFYLNQSIDRRSQDNTRRQGP